MQRIRLFRTPSLIAIALLCATGASSAADRTASKPSITPRDDREYAHELHRRLLGREPTPAELQATLRGFAERPHRIRAHNDVLDSVEFRTRVDDGTYLHGLFRQLRGREPWAHEIVAGMHFLEDGVPRSEIFGSLLHTEAPVRRVTARLERLYRDMVLDFRPRRLGRYERQAREMQALSREELRAMLANELGQLGGVLQGPPEPAMESTPDSGDLQVYFGYLHAHTSVSFDALSNGSPGPFKAFEQARYVAELDFLGLSDHAEYITLWPWNNEWDVLQTAADAFNRDHQFVALRGFEYSNPIYGHLNVFGTPGFTNTFLALGLPQFYAWLSLHPDAAATFNHPGSFDPLGVSHLHFAYFPSAAQQMVGVEILTHLNETGPPDEYERYSVGYVASDGLGHLDEAIQKGWRVAGVSAQDNHRGTWGVLDDYRTGVLASRLTREGILEGIRRRRFYSTQDKNLLMSFQADGQEMGSVLAAGDKVFRVELDDEDGEGFFEIRFFANGQLAETRDVSDTGAWEFTVPASSEAAYYYVMVVQDDGDRAMSAPIWVRAQE